MKLEGRNSGDILVWHGDYYVIKIKNRRQGGIVSYLLPNNLNNKVGFSYSTNNAHNFVTNCELFTILFGEM